MIWVLIVFVVGLVLTIKGGEYFVDGASWIGEVSGIPSFIVGATIVSVATTLPEMIVSIMAVMDGKVAMSVGNALGTVTANTALVMGIALLCMPFVIQKKDYLAKLILLIVGVTALFLFCSDGTLTSMESICMLGLFVLFIIENLYSATRHRTAQQRPLVSKKDVYINVGKFVIGTLGIAMGARILVNSGSEIARMMGMSESVIGVTIIGVGAALPELVTMISSLKKGDASMAVGNVIGANIIDLASILPTCALLAGGGLTISAQSFLLDLPICMIMITIGVVPAMITGGFRRWQGALLLMIYTGYMMMLLY